MWNVTRASLTVIDKLGPLSCYRFIFLISEIQAETAKMVLALANFWHLSGWQS